VCRRLAFQKPYRSGYPAPHWFAGVQSPRNEVPDVNPFASKMRKAMQILCPFCKAEVPVPRRIAAVFTPEGCLAERCPCGAAYVVDETGRLGGQALLDAQAVLCNGDLDQAMTLASADQIEVRHQPCRSHVIHLGGGRLTRTAASARAWFVRRRVGGRPPNPSSQQP
jgi:hypothetical protein